MIPELEIEHQVLIAFAQENLPSAGALSTAAEGAIKGIETCDAKAFMAVAVSAPAYAAYLAPNCEFAVSLALTVRRETSPNGAALVAFLEPISNTLMRLQADAEYVRSALSSEHFCADGVLLEGGQGPIFDKDSNSWTITRQFSLKGIITFEEDEA